MAEAEHDNDQEAINKATEDYNKLLAEVIALHSELERNGPDGDVNWKNVNKQIDKRNNNRTFVRMTQGLRPEKIRDDLRNLENNSLNEFLTVQANNLNRANNQIQQPQNAHQIERQIGDNPQINNIM